MLWIAVLFFSLAAVLGLWLISYLLQNKETPKGLAFIHGPLGAIGIVFLLLYAIFYSGSFFIPVIVFIMAAFLGFILIYRDLTGKNPTKMASDFAWLNCCNWFCNSISFDFYAIIKL